MDQYEGTFHGGGGGQGHPLGGGAPPFPPVEGTFILIHIESTWKHGEGTPKYNLLFYFFQISWFGTRVMKDFVS